MTAEDKLDELEIAVNKLINRVESKEQPTHINEKKNSHLHMMIETSLINKIEKQAKEKNMSVAEFVRQKLRENNQLDRIENKLDRLINKN
jgi:hypothetical protein